MQSISSKARTHQRFSGQGSFFAGMELAAALIVFNARATKAECVSVQKKILAEILASFTLIRI